jgi:hypothetical protein
MKSAHLIFGITLFAVFTITGQQMRADFPDKEIISQELRILMRSRHIYILFGALMHILVGVYLQNRPRLIQRSLQLLGSLGLFASAVVLVWAFYAETYTHERFSNISRWGIYIALGSTIFHMMGGTDRLPWSRET